MAWSLGNYMITEDVEKLVASKDDVYEPGIERAFSREQALSIIHAAIWGYGCRAGTTAGAYAFMNLMEALGIKAWSFEAEDKVLSDAAIRENGNG